MLLKGTTVMMVLISLEKFTEDCVCGDDEVHKRKFYISQLANGDFDEIEDE